MSRIIILLIILTSGCAEYPNVVRVCANYLKSNSYCGTGFFVSPDTLHTATHVAERSDSNVLTAIGPGINQASNGYTSREGTDISTVPFRESLTTDICPVCDGVVIDAEVVMLGVLDYSHDIHERRGFVGSMRPNGKIYIDGETQRGFSGGPVIDVERKCVIGVIHGRVNDTQVLAWAL